MIGYLRFVLLIAILFVISSTPAAYASWTQDGIPVALQPHQGGQPESGPQITTDGLGGTIVTWVDGRSVEGGIYAQRVDANGTTLWAADGVAICTEGGYQVKPQIISDGSGGAIITWEDYRSVEGGIYAQRIDANGDILWTANGVAICTAMGYKTDPRITTDGSGGAIITWEGNRNLADYEGFYAQRIDASGVVQWTADGVAICTATDDQYSPQIASDGAGGAIISWEDYRIGYGFSDIYAQRIDASGGGLGHQGYLQCTGSAGSGESTEPNGGTVSQKCSGACRVGRGEHPRRINRV